MSVTSLNAEGSHAESSKGPGERQLKAMFQLQELKNYVSTHMDDVVQEGRWRTTISKEFKLRHRALSSKVDSLERLLTRSRPTGAAEPQQHQTSLLSPRAEAPSPPPKRPRPPSPHQTQLQQKRVSGGSREATLPKPAPTAALPPIAGAHAPMVGQKLPRSFPPEWEKLG